MATKAKAVVVEAGVKKNEMPDWYRVKYRQKGASAETPWRYGIFDKYDKDAKKQWAKGFALVTDALEPRQWIVSLTDYDIEEIKFGARFGEDEYDKFIQKAYDEAEKTSENAEGAVGRMFAVGVADGSAHYVITKQKGKQVFVEWRGFCPDRWFDQILGAGGWVPYDRVKGMCHTKERAKLFPKLAPML